MSLIRPRLLIELASARAVRVARRAVHTASALCAPTRFANSPLLFSSFHVSNSDPPAHLEQFCTTCTSLSLLSSIADAICELLCGTVDGKVALFELQWERAASAAGDPNAGPAPQLSPRWLCESDANHSAVTALDTVASADLRLVDAGSDALCALVGRDSGALDLYLLPPSASASRGAVAAASIRAPQLLGSIVRFELLYAAL